jgi:hypothetical protein
LTEEEKKAKLEELRQKLKEKRANQEAQAKEEAKRNEVRPANPYAARCRTCTHQFL